MAGESARESARRQREKADRLLRSAERWEKGADGEAATAAVLDALPRSEWTVFHDVRWPGRRRANIDHVVVGPSGIFVVDSKNWSGTIEVRVGVLRQDGRPRDKAVTGAADAARALGDRLATIDPVHVHPVLCFATDEPLTGWTRDVMVCSTPTLERLLLSRPAADLPTSSLVREVDAALRDAADDVRRPTHRRERPAEAATDAPAAPKRRARRKGRPDKAARALAGLVLAVGLFVFRAPIADWFTDQLDPTADGADPCAELNATYPHGVGRKTATDDVAPGEQKVTGFARKPQVYLAHRALDTDRDGIACERG